jgi:phosphatidate cytidylyltransferase
VERNLQLRILSALTLGIAFIGAIYWSAYTAIALFSLILVLGLYEFFNLCSAINPEVKPNRSLAIVLSLSLFGVLSVLPGMIKLNMLFPRDYFLCLAALFVVILGIFCIELFRNKNKPFENMAAIFMGAVYLAIPLGLIVSSSVGSDGSYQPWNILYFFFFMWASDTGAYFVGKFAGKRKLFERLSPKKTVEGFLGGMLASALLGWLAFTHLGTMGLPQWLGIGILLSITGTAGDLFESMLKRQAGIKDSGSILPGHGGILDRFDSALLSAPVYWMILYLAL